MFEFLDIREFSSFDTTLQVLIIFGKMYDL